MNLPLYQANWCGVRHPHYQHAAGGCQQPVYATTVRFEDGERLCSRCFQPVDLTPAALNCLIEASLRGVAR